MPAPLLRRISEVPRSVLERAYFDLLCDFQVLQHVLEEHHASRPDRNRHPHQCVICKYLYMMEPAPVPVPTPQ